MKATQVLTYFSGLYAALGTAGAATRIGRPVTRHKKKPRPCLLARCENLHTHNNSFCCAEHCREYRAEKKAMRQGRPS